MRYYLIENYNVVCSILALSIWFICHLVFSWNFDWFSALIPSVMVIIIATKLDKTIKERG